MEKITVVGGKKLSGEVNISLAKNSVLPIIVASILCPEKVIIDKAPLLEDVLVLCDLLKELNCEVELSSDNLLINTEKLVPVNSSSDLIKKMRASFLIMGPMLARFGHCELSSPGGCNIGSRPIDLHLKGFKA